MLLCSRLSQFVIVCRFTSNLPMLLGLTTEAPWPCVRHMTSARPSDQGITPARMTEISPSQLNAGTNNCVSENQTTQVTAQRTMNMHTCMHHLCGASHHSKHDEKTNAGQSISALSTSSHCSTFRKASVNARVAFCWCLSHNCFGNDDSCDKQLPARCCDDNKRDHLTCSRNRPRPLSLHARQTELSLARSFLHWEVS